jgi:hypothetical protein
MLNAIEAGRIFVRDGITLPKTVQIESEIYIPGWRLVKTLDGYGLGRKIHDARWTFFCLAYETKAAVFGMDEEKMMHRAIERILANRESEAEKFNSLEIARVAWWASERFFGIRHLAVSAQSRHIQESPFLFRPSAQDCELAAPNGIALRPEQGLEPSKGLPVGEIKKPNLEAVPV